MRARFPSLLAGTATFLAFFCAATARAQKTINVPADQPTIQAAINAAATGDTVLVAPGTYLENIDFIGKAITVTSSGGAAKTIIDGAQLNPVVRFRTGELRSSVISGFTLRNGVGGVYVGAAAPSILNSIITSNYCSQVYVNFGAAHIEGNTVSNALGVSTVYMNNYCDVFAAGVDLGGNGTIGSYTHSEVIGNIIENNTHGAFGGGMEVYAADGSVIQGNIIRNNQGSFSGGLEVVNIASIFLSQNLIYGNRGGGNTGSDAGGAAINPVANTGPFLGVIANNTILGNSLYYASSEAATELALSGGLSQYLLINNIIVGSNSTPAVHCGVTYAYLAITPLVIDHNDIFNPNGPAYGGSCADQTGIYGNLSADPLFVNASTFDLHLRSGSPAIDAGNNSAPMLPTTDFDKAPRLQDATGKGFPIVDMGAYEYAGLQNPPYTVLTLTPSTYSPKAGGPVTLTVALSSPSGQPTGAVTLFEDLKQIGVVLISSTGSTTFVVNNLLPGIHDFLATYPGSGGFPASNSVKFYLYVPKYAVTLTLFSSINPSISGQGVTFTVTSSSADGSIPSPVVLTDSSNGAVFATLVPDSSGKASVTTTSLTVGYHSLVASFAGDATHATANAYLLQQVLNGYATTTTLSSSANPSTLNQTVTFTAHVTSPNGTPAGSITFTDGASTLATQPLDTNSNAIISLSTLTAGAHNITATFVPTGSFAGSAASLTQTVNGLTSIATLTAQPTTAAYGSPITLTAAITTPSSTTTAPTGTVTFCYVTTQLGQTICTGTVIASVPVNPATGTASVTSSAFPAGTSSIGCLFSGDATFSSAKCNAVSITVTAAATALQLTASRAAAPALTPITLSAALTGSGGSAAPIANASITFTLDGNLLLGVATTSVTGVATLTSSAIPVGQHIVTASFAGDTAHTASASQPVALTITPNASATTLSATPNPAYQNQLVTLSATVASSTAGLFPYGTLSLYEGSTLLGSQTVALPLANPVLSLVTSAFAPGTHTLTATYAPADANFIASTSAPLTLTILPQTYTLTVDPASTTIVTEHHRTVTVSLASIGSLTGAFSLSCGKLPPEASCTWDHATLQLPANGTASTALLIDTDAVPLFKASLNPPSNPPVPRKGVYAPIATPIALAALLPLLLTRRNRRRAHRLGTLLPLVLCTLAAALTLTACSTKYPAHTPPGTYTLSITATPLSSPTTPPQTVNMPLTVTP